MAVLAVTIPGESPLLGETDRVGSLEVRQHHDVERLGAGSRTERVELSLESALELVGSHGWEEAMPSKDLVSSGADRVKTRGRAAAQ